MRRYKPDVVVWDAHRNVGKEELAQRPKSAKWHDDDGIRRHAALFIQPSVMEAMNNLFKLVASTYVTILGSIRYQHKSSVHYFSY